MTRGEKAMAEPGVDSPSPEGSGAIPLRSAAPRSGELHFTTFSISLNPA